MLHTFKYFIFIFAVFCTTSSWGQQKSVSKKLKLEVTEFDQKLSSATNPQLIDVRTPEEYKKGHLKNALNVDWNSNEFDTMIEALDPDQPVYVYCLSGGRSTSAAEKLRASGFNTIYELDGGIMAWNKAEKPTVKLKRSSEPEMSLADYKKQLNSDKLVLVDFNAPWCAPCKKMAPMLEELARSEKNNVFLVKINIDDQKNLARELNVHILPTLILYKNEQVAWKHEGYIGRDELIKVISKNLN
jgi:thioredoxin 1